MLLFPTSFFHLIAVFCYGKGKAIFVDYARGKARASLKDVVEGLDLLDVSAQHVYPIILLDLWDKINRLTQIYVYVYSSRDSMVSSAI